MQSMVEQLLMLSRIEDAADINLEHTVNMTQLMEVLRRKLKRWHKTDTS